MAEKTLQATAAQLDTAVSKVLTGELIPHAPANGKLHGSINKSWAEIPMPSASIMFFGVENGNPVAGHTSPLTAQTILPITHLPANPGTWHDVVTFNIASDLYGTELEFVPDNLFNAKFWVRSDMLRTGAQFRLTASNVRTGATLATGTVSVNLGQTGELQPVIITGRYELPAVVLAEDIRMVLQVLSPLFGVQIGIFSIPPNEISYISRLISAPASPPSPVQFFNGALEYTIEVRPGDTLFIRSGVNSPLRMWVNGTNFESSVASISIASLLTLHVAKSTGAASTAGMIVFLEGVFDTLFEPIPNTSAAETVTIRVQSPEPLYITLIGERT